ncbi:unnamed protein product [Echinostoma caproni]|uniref:START domain-containing protein n=1 Tax=Echinostoma caproni TaxID=27848 RepID=A0A183A104_9TREM|nr:unnamed protein product [Echinostoma caproni]
MFGSLHNHRVSICPIWDHIQILPIMDIQTITIRSDHVGAIHSIICPPWQHGQHNSATVIAQIYIVPIVERLFPVQEHVDYGKHTGPPVLYNRVREIFLG